MKWWLSSKKMTVQADTNEDGIIVFTADITKKFIGQPLQNLENWLQKQGGFQKVQLHGKKTMSFAELFQIEETDPKTPPKKQKKAAKPKASEAPRGCEPCPLDKIEGLVKIMPVIDPAKKLLVIAQSPGPEENDAGKELVGRSGKFFWGEMAKVGINRDDVNVFNAVKCWPVDVLKGSYQDTYKMRNPSKEELHCCSIHSDNALQEAKSKHILILGQMAAQTLLKMKKLPSQKIFYSELLKAKVYLVDHPAFFIRSGVTLQTDSGKNAKLAAMRATLALLKKDIDGNDDVQDAFGYLRKQKYYLVNSLKNAIKAGDYILKKSRAGERISVDIENFTDGQGRTVITHCGFSPQPGVSFVFVFKKPEVIDVAKTLLADGDIRKAMQYGCSDVSKLQDEGIVVRGYDFDTMYGEYFDDPDRKKYGLDEIAELHFPEFSGYKTIAYPDILENSNDVPESVLTGNNKVRESHIRRHKLWDIRKLQAETVRLYNGADCDVTKRAELRTATAAPAALMKLYIDLGFVLYQMEANGPLFDYQQHEKLSVIYPHREKLMMKELRAMAGDEKFNPNSPNQVKVVLFEKLGLEFPGEGKVNTRKETLLVLGRQHPFPLKLRETRKTVKARGTYVDGFLRCANRHEGRLRTRWKSTGTATGRLSSGKGKDDSDDLVNLQNIHGEPLIKNMCISDQRWREVLASIQTLMQPWLAAKKKLNDYLYRVDKKFDGQEETIKANADKYSTALKHFTAYRKAIAEAYTELCLAAERWVRETMPDLQTNIGADYGQVEVRVAAQVCRDKQLIQDCMGSDIHSAVGVTMTGWSPAQIRSDKKIRTLTKNIHFGVLFGQSEDGTVRYVQAVTPMEDLAKISEEFIREGYRRYHARYPGVRKFIEKQRRIAKEFGYVETIFGLRRPLIIDESSKFKQQDELNLGDDEDPEDEFFDEEQTGKRNTYWGNICINCVDYETEALTQRGWLRGDQLQPGDVLLSYSLERGALEWQSATDIKQYPNYKGPIYHLNSKSFHACTTSEHRWPVIDHGRKYDMVSSELPTWGMIPRVGNYQGPATSRYSDDWIRLTGWVLTDGHYVKAKPKGKAGYGTNIVTVCQSKPDMVQLIDELFTRLQTNENLQYRTTGAYDRQYDRRKTSDGWVKLNGEVFWSISGAAGAFFRTTFPKRVLTQEFLNELPVRQLHILYEAMILGDGNAKYRDGDAGCKASLCSKHKEQVDVFQALAAMCGHACTVKLRDLTLSPKKLHASLGYIPRSKKIWTAWGLSRKWVTLHDVKTTVKVEKRGMWCPVVPNSFFLARRKGKVFVTGNTKIQGSAHQLMICALVNLLRQKKKYKVLGIPVSEVHDFLGFRVNVLDLPEAYKLMRYLLEQESLNTVKKDFPHIKWQVPIITEAEAGFRMGCQVALEDGFTIGDWLVRWCLKCLKQEAEVDKELEAVLAKQGQESAVV